MNDFRVKIFLDGADLTELRKWADHPMVSGFTSNPALMRKAGITDYMAFAREYVAMAQGRPVSLEVVSRQPEEIVRQADVLWNLGDSVYVKIPVTVIPTLPDIPTPHGRINATCIADIESAEQAIGMGCDIVSVFCGRIADSGRNAFETMYFLRKWRNVTSATTQLLWASPRQAYNVYEADESGADIITLHPRLFERFLQMRGAERRQMTKDVCEEFYAAAEGYTI